MTEILSPPAASISRPSSHFPARNGPRVWIISAGDSPIGISLARQLLEHGDHVVAGITPLHGDSEDPPRADFEAFLAEITAGGNGDIQRGTLQPVELDVRCVMLSQSL